MNFLREKIPSLWCFFFYWRISAQENQNMSGENVSHQLCVEALWCFVWLDKISIWKSYLFVESLRERPS